MRAWNIKDRKIEHDHIDDVIGMMAYLEQHTDGRVTRGRYGVLGLCDHLAKLRDVFLSGSFRINYN